MERQRSDYCKDQGAGCAVPYLATGSRRSEKPFCPAFHAGVAKPKLSAHRCESRAQQH